MNNEEKILSMLTTLTEKVDRLETTQAKQGKQLTYLTERVDEIDSRSLRSAVMLENQVLPQLQLLYEGHGTIMEKLDGLAPKSRVEILEDEVSMLKDVIKLMRQDIAELKKAQ